MITRAGSWSATKRSRRIALILLALIALIWIGYRNAANRCVGLPSFKEVPNDPVILLDQFKSYQKSRDVKARIKAMGYSARVAKNDFDSDFNLSQVVIYTSEFENRGIHGQLRMPFLNNRLAAASFYPSHFQRYLTLLNEEGIPLSLPMKGELPDREGVPMGRHRRVRIVYAQSWGVEWYDERLDREYEAYWAAMSSD